MGYAIALANEESAMTKAKTVNCSIFADEVIESMGWPEQFERSPLLRSALELAIAWTFEKWRRGDQRFHSPQQFANLCLDLADNRLVGTIDLISSDLWPGARALRQAFADAVAAGLEPWGEGAAASGAFADWLPSWTRARARKRRGAKRRSTKAKG